MFFTQNGMETKNYTQSKNSKMLNKNEKKSNFFYKMNENKMKCRKY